jgi:hypothetical protein
LTRLCNILMMRQSRVRCRETNLRKYKEQCTNPNPISYKTALSIIGVI